MSDTDKPDYHVLIGRRCGRLAAVLHFLNPTFDEVIQLSVPALPKYALARQRSFWRRRFQNAVPEIKDERSLARCLENAFNFRRHPLASSDKHQRIKVALDAAPQGTLDSLRGPP